MQAEPTWKPLIQKGEDPLYITLVRAISEDIGSGRLQTGYRLPTQRELADELGIALGTVTRAYSEAERKGLVHGDGRRGTFVGTPPKVRSVLATLNRTVEVGVDFSRNHPAYSIDPDLATALRQIAKGAGVQKLLEYPPQAGFEHHREAGAQWLSSLGKQVSADSVFLTVGAQQAILATMAAECRPGDVIATEEYTYPGVKSTADILGLQLLGIEMDEEGLIPESFESLCRHKHVRLLYCSPTFQNPTNTVMSGERRRRVAEIAQKYDVSVVEDEILSPLMDSHPGYISNLMPEKGYTIVSASKAVAAGLRLGFVVAPTKAQARLIDILQLSSLGVPALMGEVFAQWYHDGVVDETITRRKKELAIRQEIARDILQGYKIRSHSTSYHVWLELPEGWSSMKFAIEAQMRGVATSPAEIFAYDSRSGINAVRLSVGAVSDRVHMRTGLEILRNILAGIPTEKRAMV